MDRISKKRLLNSSRVTKVATAAVLSALCTGLASGPAFAEDATSGGAQMPTTKHQAQVLGHFGELDTDRDGRLTSTEWEQYRQYAGDNANSAMANERKLTLGELKQVDENGDGFVNYSELYAAENPDLPRPSSNPSSIKEVFEKSSFSALDKDGDNRVSLAEAARGSMLAMDDHAPYDYYTCDTDGDGNLSSDEFGKFQQAVRRRMPGSAAQ